MSGKTTKVYVPVQQRVGQRFGRLVVLAVAFRRKKKTYVNCRCDCGGEATVEMYHLQDGHTTSCGCMRAVKGATTRRTHGKSGTKEYHAWVSMTDRCYNPNAGKFRHYGGRGIKVCERWRTSSAAFLADMGKAPSPKHELDRIDVNGDYSPANCRWATRSQQMRNTRFNHRITFEGRTLLLVEWGEVTGLGRNVIGFRLKRGWSVKDALTLPRGSRPKARCRDASEESLAASNPCP